MNDCDALFETLVHTSPDGIVICSSEGRVEYLSEAGRAMFQITGDDLARGINFYQFLDGPEQLERAQYYLSELMAGRPTGFAEYQVLRRDGTPFWAEANANLLPAEGAGSARLFLIFRDITRRKRDEEQLRRYALELESLNRRLQELSTRDPLTGLLNRRQLDLSFENERQRCDRSGGVFSVAMIDVDHFKTFNDRFGHLAGDEVLTTVADLVRRSVRRNDLVFRYGGEELLLLLPDTTAEQAAVPLEALRAAAAGLVHLHRGQPLPSVTVSIGVADWSRVDETLADLVEAADRALYQAKAEGRNLVRTSK